MSVLSDKIVATITQESEIVIAGEWGWLGDDQQVVNFQYLFTVEMPDLQSGVYPIGTDSLSQDESESVFENKTGLAEDLKFLASMPELCDVTFLVGDTREPVCAVKVTLTHIPTHFY